MKNPASLMNGTKVKKARVTPAADPMWRLSRNGIILCGLVIALVIGYLGTQNRFPVNRVGYFFYDFFSRLMAAPQSTSHAVVVDVDDNSLKAAGQWPWPRYRVAALIEAIAAQKPAAIGLDILFPEPDRTALSTISKTFQNEFGLDLRFSGVPPGLDDNDGYLGHVLAQTRAVGARFFFFDHVSEADGCPSPAIRFSGESAGLHAHVASGMLCNIPAIATGLKSSGFINNRMDDDGLLRSVPLLIKFQGDFFPHLSLTTLAKDI